MMYQARYCHLEFLPEFGAGDIVPYRDKIGTMGNTGHSSAPHLHFDIIQTIEPHVYRLNEIQYLVTDWEKLARQYHFFLDHELFNYPLEITSHFGDLQYLINGEFKYHPAYDIVPEDRHTTKRHFDIYWNRTKPGRITSVGYDSAYGNYITIAFEA